MIIMSHIEKKPDNILDNEKNNDELEKYEKIGNRILKLDRYSSYCGDGFLYSLFLIFYIGAIDYVTPLASKSSWFYKNIMYILPVFFIYLSLILMVSWIVLMFLARRYEYKTTYDINKIIKLYLYELSKNPNNERKKVILKHLIFNLWRLQSLFQPLRNKIFQTINERYYFDFIKNRGKIISQIIHEVINFLNYSFIYLPRTEISAIYTEIGDYFEQKNYIGIFQKLKTSKNIFSDALELIRDKEIKSGKQKIKNIGRWLATYGLDTIKYLAVVGLIILLLLGRISNFTIP